MTQTTTHAIANRAPLAAPLPARTARAAAEESAPAPGRLLTERDVAKHLGVTLPTLAKWHRAGKGPTRIQLARNVTRYIMEDVKVYLEKLRTAPPVTR
ncbi:helix-turn-helix transcriptional regulator [Acidocella sp.]|uniref:helix-turn-helix transcriptional regulator n=1 Tax=Acidocella sp. TaxID=50710 RepID=UPI003D0417B6